MADPGQVYHNSGTPPLLYYQGNEYIGGSVAYDRSVTIAAPGFIMIGNPDKNEISNIVGTIDLS